MFLGGLHRLGIAFISLPHDKFRCSLLDVYTSGDFQYNTWRKNIVLLGLEQKQASRDVYFMIIDQRASDAGLHER